MKEWNMIVASHWGQEKRALRFLNQHGEFRSSGFKDVLRGKVDDVTAFLERMEGIRGESPESIGFISQIVPLERTFYFELSEFMEKLKEIVFPMAEKLGDKKFYVRAKRRGHKGEMSSQEIEKEVAGFIMESLEKAGKKAQVGFTDPDVIVVVETVANWAGVAWVTREMKERYPFIRVK